MSKLLPASPAYVPPRRVAGARSAIDSLVQAALVELFAAYGVAVAPLPRSSAERAPTLPDISTAAALTIEAGARRQGRLTLSLPTAVLQLMKGVNDTGLKEDWARELCNQLTGRLKNRLLPFSVRLHVGALSLVESATLSRQLPSQRETRVYAVRTLRGEIVVTLQGLPDERDLVYVGTVNAANEGDAIWF